MLNQILKRIHIVVLTLCILFAAVVNANTKYDRTNISLIKLSVYPDKYEGQKIIHSGFLVVKSNEVPMLYFSKDSYLSASSDYVVLNSIPEENMDEVQANCNDGCYASALGTFYYEKYNSPADFIGFVDDVSKIVLWDKGK